MVKPTRPKRRRFHPRRDNNRGNFKRLDSESELKFIPEGDIVGRPIFLFDNDDFYGLTLDMVLFNLKQEGFRKVLGREAFNYFNAQLKQGKYKNGIYIIDEYFADNLEIDLERLIADIKEFDPEAKLLCYSVSDEETDNINLRDKFDHIVLKSGLSNESSIIKTLSELLGVEFIMDNSDPEHEA